VYIWDIAERRTIYISETLVVDFLHVAWSPDGTSLIASSAEGITAEGNALLVTLDGLQTTLIRIGMLGAYWSPDGSTIAYLGAIDVTIVDSVTFEILESYLIGGTPYPALIDSASNPWDFHQMLLNYYTGTNVPGSSFPPSILTGLNLGTQLEPIRKPHP
jgi:hypothetical protein